MGEVRFRGRVYRDVAGVRLSTGGRTTHVLRLQRLDRYENIMFTASVIRAEVSGDTQILSSNNCAYVFGDVGSVKVSNVLAVQGHVHKYDNMRGIQVDKMYNVQEDYDAALSRVKEAGRATVIKLHNVSTIVLDPFNATFLAVVRGNVTNLSCNNCCFIKGDVQFAKVGNIIKSTMGVGPSKADIQRKKEAARQQMTADMMSSFSDIFK